ncbi:hypothetical protein JCM8547_003649 [Rhodosporidiobolus lusitaniae]
MTTLPSHADYAPLETPTNELPDALAASSTVVSPFPPGSEEHRPLTTAEHVDLLFKRWTSVVSQRMRRREKGKQKEGLEEDPVLDKEEEVRILKSVIKKWRAEEEEGEELGGQARFRVYRRGVPEMDHERCLGLVDEIREAISSDVHPRLNKAGSSGSYFARNVKGETLGIFKPADEEPYGALNPKFLKWLHRNFLSRLIPFGRSCLIPGQSFVSEAAASTLDRLLETNIVPRTEVCSLSSPAFFYDWIDLEKAKRRGGKLREKVGSLQVFVTGYTDASKFLREHPLNPSPSSHPRSSSSPPRRKKHHRSCLSSFFCFCGRTGAESFDEEEALEGKGGGGRDGAAGSDGEDGFRWTDELVQSLREGLERLVIIDFLMRNTDRGMDNFMLSYATSDDIDDPPAAYSAPPAAKSSASGDSSTTSSSKPRIRLAAIDNSLSWPHKHPTGWRSHPYGWLYLPLSLIGQPWSASTRREFLPKLTDPAWWSRLKVELRNEFKKDVKGFREEWWERQWALVKGQGLNLAESLRCEDEGPIELCRRPKKLVWDDYVLVSEPSSSAPPVRLTQPSATQSFDQAVDDLSFPIASTTSPSTRPSPNEHHSSPPAIALSSLSTNATPSRPPPIPRTPAGRGTGTHRRTVSDYSTFSYSSISARPPSSSSHRPPQVTQTFAKTTRPPSFCSSPSEAAHLRRPLDSLSASLSHPSAPTPPTAELEAEVVEEDQRQEGEEAEETGMGLMRRLDEVERAERKRLKKAVKKDEEARRAVEAVAEEQEQEEGERETDALLSRSVPSSSALAGFARRASSVSRASGAAGSGKRWRKLFRRSVSDDHRSSAVLSEGEEEEAEPDRERATQSAFDERMTLSWYAGAVGGGGLDGVHEEDEGGDEQEAEEGRKVRKRWVVVERIEDVVEPKSKWAWPW